jgi:hypothetical protein
VAPPLTERIDEQQRKRLLKLSSRKTRTFLLSRTLIFAVYAFDSTDNAQISPKSACFWRYLKGIGLKGCQGPPA